MQNLIKPWTHYFEVLNNPASTHQQIFEAFNQYRILCALRRGLNGSVLMNQRIETALAKQGLIKIRRSPSQVKAGSLTGPLTGIMAVPS